MKKTVAWAIVKKEGDLKGEVYAVQLTEVDAERHMSRNFINSELYHVIKVTIEEAKP